MSQYLNLAKKIHALAKEGADGEKVNAEVLLNKLLKKHGLTMADLEDETIKLHSFKVPKEDHKLFHQISALVLGKDYEILWNRSKPTALYINCTKSVAIEIESKFEFYIRKN